ncbi:HAMP domain-containing histidine kinase [Dechloromonas sp. XY25]|uniref:histidine kinase n=1 Tax=Dechloromonas hankyongensis TaxID=2908002 RepID=A0ABS9K1V4_9RHOO|nr:HAMP domain-containing sensor histidine kinase [Dechloromonas hankyongensis]MCG2577153.1 HAMP domain-containing histidine kinase [Dechloromonas hankyongensis]
MPFPLVRHFTLTSLVFFVAVGGALGYYYRDMALSRMLQQQEAGNTNLSTVFANALWRRHFSALLNESDGKDSQDLKNNSRIWEIHGDVVALMRGSATYKIKVYDPAGRTVYSSELEQIGEDKSGNPGFVGAMSGQTRTELVHKARFSTFEQEVENRDLIQSYIPQYDANRGTPAGVFEIYSDATPFLAELRRTEIQLALMVGGALALLFGALYLIVRRAQNIIQQQSQEKLSAQQQLAQTEKMAELGQLVAGVTHQLNTPIGFSHSNINLTISYLKELATPLLVAARLSELVKKLPPERGRVTLDLGHSCAALRQLSFRGDEIKDLILMLEDVLAGLEQMRELVGNLRDFTRLDRSKVADADLNAALKTVIYIARSSIPPRIQIIEKYGKLPKFPCNLSQLNQVFLNLITNAAQAIPEQGRIVVRSWAEANEIGIEIADTGTGISPDVLPRIFESFYTTKPRGIGTGLGLSIARDIIDNHGGRITVSSQPGQGSTFCIKLPFQAADTILAL